jgi:hypothetical protein
MLRYTARNGTTFLFPASNDAVYVISQDYDEAGVPVALDLEDLREFLQHIEDRAGNDDENLATDADLAAVGPD